MIITNTATPFDNQVVCGQRLVPADKDSAHAVYERHGRTCGITYDTSATRPFLRCNPGYQLPPYARDKQSFKRFIWECDDDRAVNIRLDVRDGELYLICDDDGLSENLEEKVESCLEFLLGSTFYEDLVRYASSFTNHAK